MRIKDAIIAECARFSMQPEMSRLINDVEDHLEQISKRYLGVSDLLGTDHPIYLLALGISRCYTGTEELEEFLYNVSGKAGDISKEAYMGNRMQSPPIHEGVLYSKGERIYFSTFNDVASVLNGQTQWYYPTYTDATRILGISPRLCIENTNNVSSIVIDIIAFASLLYPYLKTAHAAITDSDVKVRSFAIDVYQLFNSSTIMYHHRNVMFNRYRYLINGEELNSDNAKLPFSIPSYGEMLDKFQLRLLDRTIDSIPWQRVLSQLLLSKDYTVMDQLETDASLPTNFNFKWQDILNELLWANVYIDIGGDDEQIHKVIRRYIAKIKRESMLSKCKDPDIKYKIESEIKLLRFKLL